MSRPLGERWCQGTQDLWIDQIFGDLSGYGVDVGANDGTFANNTIAFERARDWTVLCVEANPEYELRLRTTRKLVEICACGPEDRDSVDFWINDKMPSSGSSCSRAWTSEHSQMRQIQVPMRTLSTLLDQHQFPRLDLLCIDVEGTELDVLRGIDLQRWTPKAIIVESWGPPILSDDATKLIQSDIERYLNPLGYIYKDRSEHDILMVR